MDTERVRISQVLAGALAAVTAALLGSTMGVAGTVVGAGLASVVSTVGGAVYLRSIQRTRESVRTVRAKVVGRSGGATVLVSDEEPEPGAEVEADTAADDQPADEQTSEDRPPAASRRRWPVLVVTTVAAFVLGMLAVTGVEWLRGESLSGGSGTTFGSIVAPHQNPGDTGPAGPASTTDPTTTTAPTTSTDPTTTGSTTTPTTSPPSDSSATTTTTPPPVTTTTGSTPSGSSISPSK